MDIPLMSDKDRDNVLDKLSLMDDIFFTKCFSGSRECTALLLRIILSRSDIMVERVKTQSWMQSILNHSVKLDILARDGE